MMIAWASIGSNVVVKGELSETFKLVGVSESDPSIDLETFLAEASAVGQFTGRGRFYVDSAKAVEKLARFALPKPGLWAVKVVQAAVVAGVSEVRFQFLRRSVQVRFANAGNWKADLVLQHLLGAGSPSESSLRHLVTGLLGASLGFTQGIRWSCGGYLVELGAQGARVEPAFDDGGVLITADRSGQDPVADKMGIPLRYLFKQTAHEFKALVDYLRVCPIAVWVDEYPLATSFSVPCNLLPKKPSYDSDKDDGRQALLGQVPLTFCGPTLGYPLGHEELTDSEKSPTEFRAFVPAPVQPVHGLVCLYSVLQCQSRINFVFDGALVGSLLEWEVTGLTALSKILLNGLDDFVVDIYLPVTSEQVDLSQFSVRVDAFDMARPMRVVVTTLIEIFERIRQDCYLPWNLTPYKPWKPQWKNTSGSDLLGAAFLTPFIPPILVLAGVVYPFERLTRRRRNQSRAKVLDTRIQEVLTGLKELAEV